MKMESERVRQLLASFGRADDPLTESPMKGLAPKSEVRNVFFEPEPCHQ